MTGCVRGESGDVAELRAILDDGARQIMRERAWQAALELYHQYSTYNPNGYRDPQRTPQMMRARLDALVAEHGFEGTRVDPMVTWTVRQGLPWSPPPINPERSQR